MTHEAYLMWVGASYYPTAEEFIKEAVEQGVSKRLPSAALAYKLASERAVVYLAHDDGEYTDCEACDSFGGTVEVLVSAERAEKKKPERQSWGYQDFVKLKRQPAKFEQDIVSFEDPVICSKCSGLGRRSNGFLFGMFIADAVEYILAEGDDEAFKAIVEERGVRTVTAEALAAERKRGCGKRKPGGFYLVTSSSPTRVDMKALVKDLVEKGKIDPEAEVHGCFARFVNTIPYDGIRFCGVKKWAVDPAAEDEAVMILEAMG